MLISCLTQLIFYFFYQVSFVNSIATIKGGTHVDYITKQIITYIQKEVKNMKPNVIIVNPHTVIICGFLSMF